MFRHLTANISFVLRVGVNNEFLGVDISFAVDLTFTFIAGEQCNVVHTAPPRERKCSARTVKVIIKLFISHSE